MYWAKCCDIFAPSHELTVARYLGDAYINLAPSVMVAPTYMFM